MGRSMHSEAAWLMADCGRTRIEFGGGDPCYHATQRRFEFSLRTRGDPKQLKRKTASTPSDAETAPHTKPAFADAKRAFCWLPFLRLPALETASNA